jgi:hypothetical protein
VHDSEPENVSTAGPPDDLVLDVATWPVKRSTTGMLGRELLLLLDEQCGRLLPVLAGSESSRAAKRRAIR